MKITHSIKLTTAIWYLLWAFSSLSAVNARAEQNIVVLGDSISAAYGLDERDGWVQLLRNRLNQEDINREVINASISGETTGGGLNRLSKLLDTYQPEILIIELGGNDGLRGYPIKQMKTNLQKMIRMAQEQNAEVILLGMRIPPNYGKRYSDLFFNSYQQLSEQMTVTLIPFFLEGVADKAELMQPDGIHPTQKAQARLLDNAWPAINDSINRNARRISLTIKHDFHPAL